MAMFTGFKPSGMQKIANRLGYSGDMVNFDNYLQQNPDKQRQMIVFEEAARKMAEGGMVTPLPTALADEIPLISAVANNNTPPTSAMAASAMAA